MPIVKERPLSTALAAVGGNTLGEIFREPVSGDQYIFLPGVANCAVGSWVTYDPANGYASALLTKANADKLLPMAVAVAAVSATQWGWFKVQGRVSVLALASGGAQVPLYTCATAGSSDVVSTSQTKINRSFYDTARGGTNGLTTAYISYPSAG